MSVHRRNINPEYAADIQACVQVLRKGGIILYPTDTVWGLGCDATNAEAVSALYALKERAEAKSMLVLMSGEDQIYRYVDDPEPIALELMREAVNPLTIIYDNALGLASNLLAEDKSVGIRVPKDDFCTDLLYAFRRPLVSTSANISGQAAPAFYAEISDVIKQRVDYAVQYRRDDRRKRKPSAIIKVSTGGLFKIIRK